MSRYANNYIIDELTGEPKLVKHLNKIRVDRGGWNKTSGGWNKTGKKARMKKRKSFHCDSNLEPQFEELKNLRIVKNLKRKR